MTRVGEFAFTVHGVAQAKGSMRAFAPKGGGRPIVTDGNRNVKGWQYLVASAAGDALARVPDDTRARLYASALRCELVFYLPRPKALRAAIVPHTKRPDIDKLVRAACDALTGIVWHDDAQVVELVAVKRYAETGAGPRVDVRVTLEPQARIAAPLLVEARS